MTRVQPGQSTVAPRAARDAPERVSRHDPAARRAVVALAAVAGLYVIVQLLLFTLTRSLSWDEIVYLAQHAPGEIGMDWGAQRARGTAWLVAPVALFHAATPVVRLYLIALSGLGLFLAFRPWVRVLGPLAAAAAFVFGFSWIGLYFGMEVFPNLPAAFATVAAAGYLTDMATTGRPRALIGLAASVALIAVFRPPDSVWLSVAMFVAAVPVAWLAAGWRRVVSIGGAFTVGGLVGWAPWLIEMGLRYGGPLQALAAARTESASGRPRDDIDQYLNLIEGPVRLIVEDPTLTYRALAGLLGVAALLGVALVHRHRRVPAVIAVTGMAGGLVPYIVLHTGVNLRYLLPAWGLASVAVAIGGAAVVQSVTRAAGRRGAAAGLVVALALAGVWGVGNLRIADYNAKFGELNQAGMYLVAEEVTEYAAGRDCAFVSEYGYPQLAWATHCIGLEMDVYGQSGQCPLASHSLAALAEQGYTVFALARSELPDDLMVSEWDARRLDVRGYGPWRIYVPSPRQVAAGAVPRTPRDGEASVPCPLSRAVTADEIQPLRIGPRLPGDTTVKFLQRRQGLAEEIK